MHKKIIITAETGSDLTEEMAKALGVYLVPMHVSMGNVTKDDGSFPAEEVCDYYNRTKKVPKTSGSTPADFELVFAKIRRDHPGKQILHLAYSAVTTCAYQSAVIASEGNELISIVDTKHVSVGQAYVVMLVRKYLNEHPETGLKEAAEYASYISKRVQMCFIPNNLDYLRAGGRVSNAASLVGNILKLHPCIEIIDGKLMAQKKYRGNLNSIMPKLMEDFCEKYSLLKDEVYLITTPGLSKESMDLAEETARKAGFKNIHWMKTGCVITCHGGPGAYGIVGLSKI